LATLFPFNLPHTYFKIAWFNHPYKYNATHSTVKINYAQLANTVAN